jgi:hypothetical protein
VDAIQRILGDVLLLLAALGAVLLAVIILLMQANFILWLVGKLTKGLQTGNPLGTSSDHPRRLISPRWIRPRGGD